MELIYQSTKKKRINNMYSYWNVFCKECGEVKNVSLYKEYGSYICQKHRSQFKRHGKTIENTRFENNSYNISECGNFAIIDLRDAKANIVATTIVDIEDLPEVLKHRIHRKKSERNGAMKLNYAVAKISRKNVRLHHVIMGNYNQYDHIDNDGLNNRKENLREITISRNGMNKRKQTNNTSGVVGIHLLPSGSWLPQIKKDRKMIRLSVEKSFDRAVIKRLIAEAEYFKEYSNNYCPDSNTIELTYISKDDGLQTQIEVGLQGNIIKFHKNPKNTSHQQ